MKVRFFNDALGPVDAEGKPTPRLLIGLEPEHLSTGERFEAVHVATDLEKSTFGAAYEAYETAENEKKKAAARTGAEAAEKAEPERSAHEDARSHPQQRGR